MTTHFFVITNMSNHTISLTRHALTCMYMVVSLLIWIHHIRQNHDNLHTFLCVPQTFILRQTESINTSYATQVSVNKKCVKCVMNELQRRIPTHWPYMSTVTSVAALRTSKCFSRDSTFNRLSWPSFGVCITSSYVVPPPSQAPSFLFLSFALSSLLAWTDPRLDEYSSSFCSRPPTENKTWIC